MPAKDKKRIKPVIEEVVEETPIVSEPPKEEIQPSIVETPVEVVENKDPESEPEKAPEENTEKETKHKENKMNLKLVIVITLVSALVAAFVSGGVYVYLSGLDSLDKPQNEIVLEPEETPSVSPSPTPEPEAEVDVAEYTVQVLNGSGAIGAASGGEDVLNDAGFSVEATGNAGRYDYESTTVQVKSTVPAEVVDKLKAALEEGDYEVEIGDSLADSAQYDIVVIVGAN